MCGGVEEGRNASHWMACQEAQEASPGRPASHARSGQDQEASPPASSNSVLLSPVSGMWWQCVGGDRDREGGRWGQRGDG